MNNRRIISTQTLLVFALIGASLPSSGALAQAQAFDIQSTGGSRASFESDAPLETITGVTSNVSGRITIDPNNVGATRGTVSIPVSSIRTGVDLRDEHLRSSDWLDAGSFPNATFEITGVSGATTLAPNADTRVRITGRFTIHGVSQTITANATVTYRPASGEQTALVRVRARFSVNLVRHGVSVPAVVRLKVNDDISVQVALRLHPAT